MKNLREYSVRTDWLIIMAWIAFRDDMIGGFYWGCWWEDMV